MSQYGYVKKPNFLGDGARSMSHLTGNTLASNVYATTKGWAVPMAGTGYKLASSMVWVGGVVTVTTAVSHTLADQTKVLINGATPSGYNGHYIITVTSPTTFTYALASNPGTANVTQSITSASISNSVVTNVATAHGMISDDIITISGVTPSGYNGQYRAVVIDANTFSYLNQSGLGAITVAGSVTPSGMIYSCVEILVAIGGLVTLYADALITPTFTSAISYSGTSTVVTGNVITVTITASEPVQVTGTPTIALTVGSATDFMTYNVTTSTSTSLVFNYTVLAGDHATAGNFVVGSSIVGTVSIGDILPNGTVSGAVYPVASLAYTSPTTSTTTIN